MSDHPPSSPPPVPDFETPLAAGEFFLCSYLTDWRDDEGPILTTSREEAERYHRANPKDHCLRVRLVPSAPAHPPVAWEGQEAVDKKVNAALRLLNEACITTLICVTCGKPLHKDGGPCSGHGPLIGAYRHISSPPPAKVTPEMVERVSGDLPGLDSLQHSAWTRQSDAFALDDATPKDGDQDAVRLAYEVARLADLTYRRAILTAALTTLEEK